MGRNSATSWIGLRAKELCGTVKGFPLWFLARRLSKRYSEGGRIVFSVHIFIHVGDLLFPFHYILELSILPLGRGPEAASSLGLDVDGEAFLMAGKKVSNQSIRKGRTEGTT